MYIKSIPTEFTELIPGLPEEIALECLTRLHYSTHRVATQVCRRWRHLITSKDFYYHRKETGHTHKAACLIQAIPQETMSHQKKPVGPPKYGVTLFDPVNGTWDRVDPVPQYPDGLPLFCQVTSSEGKLVLMGGWGPVNYEPVSHVFVYEFTTRRWRRAKDMPENRSFFAAGELNGHVIIAGGHDVNKNALNTAWVYNVDEDEWTELPRMSQERDECQGIAIGSEFWVVSGYTTDNQGGFVGSAEFIELGEKKWNLVEGAWKATQCPRSCLGVGPNGNLFNWAEVGRALKVGACGVQLGEKRTFVSASTYQGGPQGFFLVEGQDGQWEKLNVPSEFSGFLQSGCCIDI
uniref:F-box/kelch-repeat protein At1g15670-like n=1 Tax=Rhizophora mucronata TaxID=61149 RepID=A0A2P2L2B4_RHIMU